jgi:hypothetical protein
MLRRTISAGLKPKGSVLLPIKECQCNVELSLITMDPDYTKKGHTVFVGLIYLIQQEGICIDLRLCQ